MQLRKDVLTLNACTQLETLGSFVEEHGFCLVGGTAVALQFGHRKSDDLDFFTTVEFNPEGLSISLSDILPFEAVNAGKGTLHGMVQGTKISWLCYPYPWLEDPVALEPCPIAGIKDLAAMMLSAIASRGSRKDFADLYIICTQAMSLVECLAAFNQKFAGRLYSNYHVVRNLCYFDDAEIDPPLQLVGTPLDWDVIKLFFLEQTRCLL